MKLSEVCFYIEVVFDPQPEHLITAIQSGMVGVIPLLIDLKPNINSSQAFITAVNANRYDIVEILIKSGKYNDEFDYAIQQSTTIGYFEMIKVLLFYIEPTYIWLETATEHKHLKIIDLLLKDGRINPAEHRNKILRIAVELGNIPITVRLLQDPRVEPIKFILKWSAQIGNLPMVQQLITDTRFDPNDALLDAVKNKKYHVFDFLARNPRIDISLVKKLKKEYKI